MAKDLTFKLRLDAQDRERLEAVAAHYSAPAATAIRMLIKEKYDAIRGHEVFGVQLSAEELAHIAGVPLATIRARIAAGEKPAKAAFSHGEDVSHVVRTRVVQPAKPPPIKPRAAQNASKR